MKKNIIIHGHFYQPPRENPWIDKIEKQEGAEPYHDFNEKIDAECYTPNAFSKYLDPYGRIVDIVNNYEFISYNFGPTLLGWIKENSPDTYNNIIKADEKSIERTGSGNAIAQIYNHIIMPLASREDKYTQVKWAIDVFENHFKRKPEGIWLSETAINMETVSVLIDCGIKFTVLSPYQAEKIRDIESSKWSGVENGSISPGECYKVFEYDDKGNKIENRYLTVFFYDKILSPAISFEHLLRDADVFKDRVNMAADGLGSNPTLVHIASDGETFGHHEPFGNMALTALFKKLDDEYDFTNYSSFMKKNPPVKEVILKKGDYGTAWSCSHGVGRWYRDCGCSTDSPSNWNQSWRTPLRDSFNVLKNDLEKIICDILKIDNETFYKIREEYINYKSGVVQLEDILKKYSISSDRSVLYLCLESARYILYMFTSCAWFFGDISRLEPVQNMKYACRAIEFLKEEQPEKVAEAEREFIKILKNGISNIKEYKDGEYIYNNFAKGSKISLEKIVNYFIFNAFINNDQSDKTIYSYKIKIEKDLNTERSIDDQTLIYLKIKTEHVHSKKTVFYDVFLKKGNSFINYIRKTKEQLMDINSFFNSNKTTESYLLENDFNKFELNDLIYDQKENLFMENLEQKMKYIIGDYRDIYNKNKEVVAMIRESRLNIPQHLSVPVKYTLSYDLFENIKKAFENKRQSDEYIKNIKEIYSELKDLGIAIDNTYIEPYLKEKLYIYTDNLQKDISIENCENIIFIVNIMICIEKYINIDKDKNVIFSILKKFEQKISKMKEKSDFESLNIDLISKILKVGESLNLNVDNFKKRLNPFN